MTNEEKLNLFKSVFKFRKDDFGISYLHSNGDWRGVRASKSLDDNVIMNHLQGKSIDKKYPFPQIAGGYLVDKQNKCDIAVIDIDQDYIQFVEEYLDITREMGMPVYVECSKKKGYHIWHFFQESILAAQARNLLLGILKDSGLPEHIEVFPKQISIDRGKGLGNYINLPLNGQFATKGRMVFLNPDNVFKPYDNQWEFLQTIEYISSDYLTGVSSNQSETDKNIQDTEKKTCSEILLSKTGIGGRRPAMAKMGGYLIKRVDKDVFYAVMENWNIVNNNPPLTKDELKTQVDNLYRSYGNENNVDSGSSEASLVNHTIMAEKYREYVERLQSTRIFMGITEFDRVMRGICPGEVVIIQARPSAGKTAFAQWLMYSVWKRQQIPSLMFSLETTSELLYERGASMVLETNGQSIEDSFLCGNTKKIMEEMSDFDGVSFCDISGLSVKNMRETIENMPVRPIMLVIDYLTLIKASRGNTDQERTANTSKELHRLAKETNTAVICLSQVARDKGDETDEVRLSSGRNSGAIEEDAFFVFGMWRDPDSPTRRRIIKLLKNKRGEAGIKATLEFKNASPRLYVCDPFAKE